MRRFLLCLLLGLTLAPVAPQSPLDSSEAMPSLAREKWEPKSDFLVVLAAAPNLTFPSATPWWSLCLTDSQGFVHREMLPDPDPIAFLRKALERYDREVRGYRVTLRKQERIDGKLRSPEKIEVQFRESPFSVHFRWVAGNDRLADKALYVKGENQNKLIAVPRGVLGTLASWTGKRAVERDVDGEDARRSGRYPLSEFGFKIATQRVLKSWEKARADKALKVEYLGVFLVPQAGDRLCYKLRRTCFAQPEEDGVAEVIFFFDRENWLQVGSILLDGRGQLIGEYYFSNLELNPQFRVGQFERATLR
jgi:hypothetical protein